MSIRDTILPEGNVGLNPKAVPSWVLTIAGAVLLIAFWHYAVIFSEIPRLIFPGPQMVLEEFIFIRSLIWQHLWITLFEAIFGFVVAVSLSLIIGTAVTMSLRLRETLMPLIIAGNSIPKIAMAPIIIFYLGGGQVAKYVIAAWIAFFAILVNTIDGLDLEDEDREMMLDLYDANPWQEFRMIRFPNALPHIFDGMKLGVSLAFIGAIIGEFLAANKGLGSLVVWSLWDYNLAQAMAIVLIMGVIAAASIIGLYLIQSRVVFWREATIFGGGAE